MILTVFLTLKKLFDVNCCFRFERSFITNPVTIYGGELMAQALRAAAQTVSEGYRPNSVHCDFFSQCKLDFFCLIMITWI